MRKGQKQQRNKSKGALPKVSLHSFFKPKNARTDGGSTQAETTQQSESDLLKMSERAERDNGSRDGNPFANSRGRGISLGSNARSGSLHSSVPAVLPRASEEEEAAALSVPMSQGTGIVWRHSPAKKAMEEDALQERKPLTDLIRCVAKPLESTKTVNTKNKNKAIEELMLGGNSNTEQPPTGESLFLKANSSAAVANVQGGDRSQETRELNGNNGNVATPSENFATGQNPFARKRPAPASSTAQTSQPLGAAAKVAKHTNRTLLGRLDTLRTGKTTTQHHQHQQSSSSSGNNTPALHEKKGAGRKQALFDVLQRVEKAMAKKQQKQRQKQDCSNSGPASTTAIAAENGKLKQPNNPPSVVSFHSKQVFSTMESMIVEKREENNQNGVVKASKAMAVEQQDQDCSGALEREQQILECVVLEVFEYMDLDIFHRDEDRALVDGMCLGDKLVRALHAERQQGVGEFFIQLQGSWCNADLEIGEEINIVGKNSFRNSTHNTSGLLAEKVDQEGSLVDGTPKVVVISDTTPGVVLVRSPSRLITGTKLSAATSCTRQAALDEKVQNGFDYNPSAVFGTMKHEMIQTCMNHNTWTDEFLLKTIDLIIRDSFVSLYGAEMEMEKTVKELREFIPVVKDFMSDHMALEMSELSLQQQCNSNSKFHQAIDFGAAPGETGAKNRRPGNLGGDFEIREILDIEDYLISPTYGLKGIVDVSLKGKVKKDTNKSESTRTLMPLEIKTGREYFNHRAQLAVYVLLMEDAYREKVDQAVMWYTGKDGPSLIPVSDHDRRHILQARNYLAGALESEQLPNVLRDQRKCSRCFQLSNCMGLHKLLEGGTADSSSMGPLFSALTAHISQSHVQYFQKWYKALCLEDENSRSRNKGNYGSSSTVHVSLLAEGVKPLSQDTKNLGHCYAFKVNSPAAREGSMSVSSMLGLGIDVGDRVQLKCLDRATSFQINGRVYSMRLGERVIELILNQSLKGQYKKAETTWRLKKDVGSSLNGLLKGNLMDLVMIKGKEHVSRLRETIIDKASPRALPSFTSEPLSKSNIAIARSAINGDSDLDLLERVLERMSEMSDKKLVEVTKMGGRTGGTMSADIIRLITEQMKLISTTGVQQQSMNAMLKSLMKQAIEAIGTVTEEGLQQMSKARGMPEAGSLGAAAEAMKAMKPQELEGLTSHMLELGQQIQYGFRKRADLDDVAGCQLNMKQKDALLTALNTEDYALILGTPGSGKSTVIVEIIRYLLSRGQRVLVTSHTNTAVDNILVRLIEKDVDFVRIGNKKSVSRLVKPYMIGEEKHPVESLEEYANLVNSVNVLGCTCYNTGHPIFKQRPFDYCIVDEASQITLPAVLGPLLRSRKFILVGDNYQLPPLVASAKAELAGLNRSLFVELAESHPESVIFFEEQYRMAQDISDLSSSLIYCDRLKCGRGEVKKEAPAASEAIPSTTEKPWLAACLDPKEKVVFIDTDGVGENLETIKGSSISNEMEAEICMEILKSFVGVKGTSAESIGIMSVYNMQVNLIQQKVKSGHSSFADLVEVHTVDKFQGRDKSVIVISFVRSNSEHHCGNLLLDWRRVNVALTRAKHKLILVGSSSTLASVPILDSMLCMIRTKERVVLYKA